MRVTARGKFDSLEDILEELEKALVKYYPDGFSNFAYFDEEWKSFIMPQTLDQLPHKCEIRVAINGKPIGLKCLLSTFAFITSIDFNF